MINRNAMKF
jgi:hypothetical protein